MPPLRWVGPQGMEDLMGKPSKAEQQAAATAKAQARQAEIDSRRAVIRLSTSKGKGSGK